MSELPIVTQVLEAPLQPDEVIDPPCKPIDTFGFKIQGSCDHGCEHCYMYQGDNAPLRKQFRPMPIAIVDQGAFRIAEHAQRHGLEHVNVVLHGGEPLLSPSHLIACVKTIRGRVPQAAITAQTNAARLAPNVIERLAQPDTNVKFGVSIDGMPADHNSGRPLLGGGEGYDRVARNVGWLRDNYPEQFQGILCTLGAHVVHAPTEPNSSDATNALETHRSLMQFRPDNPNWQIDYLLPSATWNHGKRPVGWDRTGGPTPIAEWLIELFDRLWITRDPQLARVEPFSAIVQNYGAMKGYGRAHTYEAVGLGDTSYVFIDDDGSMNASDALKYANPNGDRTGLNVYNNSVDDILRQPTIALRQMGRAALSTICQQCEIVTVCGGGRFSDRELEGTFRHPSVYCPDLMKVIKHIIGEITPVMEQSN